jgi:hypothetical protein
MVKEGGGRRQSQPYLHIHQQCGSRGAVQHVRLAPFPPACMLTLENDSRAPSLIPRTQNALLI